MSGDVWKIYDFSEITNINRTLSISNSNSFEEQNYSGSDITL